MKALLVDNKVVDLRQESFEVHESMTWVDCDDTVEVGHTYENGQFIGPPVGGDNSYDLHRRMNYPILADFADAYYWQQQGDDSKMKEYLSKITEIKNKYPKG
jgi:hypothetical protein